MCPVSTPSLTKGNSACVVKLIDRATLNPWSVPVQLLTTVVRKHCCCYYNTTPSKIKQMCGESRLLIHTGIQVGELSRKSRYRWLEKSNLYVKTCRKKIFLQDIQSRSAEELKSMKSNHDSLLLTNYSFFWVQFYTMLIY